MTWLLLSILLAAAPGRVLFGRVFDATDSTPLCGAHVSVRGTTRVTATDSAGRFVIAGIDPADLQLEASHVAYVPSRARVDRARHGGVDFMLRPRTIMLAPVEIRPRTPAPPPGTVELTIDQVRQVPGATFSTGGRRRSYPTHGESQPAVPWLPFGFHPTAHTTAEAMLFP